MVLRSRITALLLAGRSEWIILIQNHLKVNHNSHSNRSSEVIWLCRSNHFDHFDWFRIIANHSHQLDDPDWMTHCVRVIQSHWHYSSRIKMIRLAPSVDASRLDTRGRLQYSWLLLNQNESIDPNSSCDSLESELLLLSKCVTSIQPILVSHANHSAQFCSPSWVTIQWGIVSDMSF